MRHLNHYIQLGSFMLLSMTGVALATPAPLARHPSFEARISHARELLGASYKKSVVRHSEKTADISEFVKEATQRFLPKPFKNQASKIAKSILAESEKYGFDPLFLVAIIQNESSFNPRQKGSFGEIGLMQIKPDTAQWLSDSLHIKYKDEKSLYDPETNIKLGSAFINKLRNQFDSHSRLYLSAYNIGAKKVRNMVDKNKTPKEYVMAVMKRYVAIYSGLNSEGDWKIKSQLAWANVRDLNSKSE